MKSDNRKLNFENKATQRGGQLELLPIAGVFISLTVVLIAASRLRFVDGDEGFYVLAAKLVLQGKVPYRDFFFTQMPLVPYAYGAWMHFVGETWTSARLLSVLAAAALGCLLYLHLLHLTKSRFAGAMSVLLFVANISTLAWFPIVKTYSLSALSLFIAYLLIFQAPSHFKLLLSGLCLGVTVDCRLYLIAAVPVFFFYIRKLTVRHAQTYNKVSGIEPFLWFSSGLAISLAPNLYWILKDFPVYYFDNFGVHAIRSDVNFFDNLREKVAIITAVLGLRVYKEGSGLPFGLLAAINFVPAMLNRKFSITKGNLSSWIALAIILVSILPSPSYYQYFSIALPFLIPGAVVLIYRFQWRKPVVVGLLLMLYFMSLPKDLYRYTKSGEGVAGVGSTRNPADWRLDTVRGISGEIEKLVHPGETVLSFWPGYLFETNAVSVKGMENHTALYISSKLDADQRTAFHVSARSDIEKSLEQSTPCVVILGNQESMGVNGDPFRQMLYRANYTLVAKIADTEIFECTSQND